MCFSPRISWWCGLCRLVDSCGWSWSTAWFRVPVLCRVVDPARRPWVEAGTKPLCFADLFVWWLDRGMLQGVLTGPFRAYVYPCFGGVLLTLVGRANVPFCRGLVVFCLAFAVGTHLCLCLVLLVYYIHAFYASSCFVQAALCCP